MHRSLAANTIGAHSLGRSRALRLAWGVLCLAVLAGCSALHPLKGVPSNYFPRELEGETRSGKRTIDLSLLRQTPPPQYLLDAGDVLGIYVEGVLGRREEVPPVHFPLNSEVPPSLGYPIPVREDGTISLPLSQPILVRGMTIRGVEDAIRRAYTADQQILQLGQDRILVSLQRPRAYNVLVIRQETSNGGLAVTGGMGGQLNLGDVKRGTGKLVALPAYKNDVLHALAETGGLPGLDAENTIYVLRRRRPVGIGCGPGMTNLPPLPRGAVPLPSPPAPTWQAEPAALHGRRGSIQQLSGETPDTNSPWGHTLLAPAPSTPAQPSPPSPGFAPPSLAPPGSPGINGSHWPPGPSLPGSVAPGTRPEDMPPPSAGFSLPAGPVWNGSAHPAIPMGPALPPGHPLEDLGWAGRDSEVVRIPVRLHPGQQPQFAERDIVLEDGDIVFIESRETEIFYTGGLLGGGQYMLPRDYDLDVLGAIAIASGRGNGSGQGGGGFGNRIGGISAMNQDISVSASDVVVLRQLPDGNQLPIKVDLRKAMRDPKYRVRIQPGDYIVLQYKRGEAVAAFVERNLLAGSLFSLAAFQRR